MVKQIAMIYGFFLPGKEQSPPAMAANIGHNVSDVPAAAAQFLIRQVIAVPGFQLQTILLIDTLSAHGMKGFLFQFLIFHRVCTSGYRQMPTSRAFLFSSPK